MSIRLAFASFALMFPLLMPAQSNVTTDNTSKPIGDNRWEWTVFIKAPPDTLAQVRCVEYLLHPTFPNRDRMICDRGQTADQPFPLTATGWGVFDIAVKVMFKDGHTENLTHHLRFDTPQPAPAGCDSAGDFSMREHAVHEIGANLPGLYLYAEEIHGIRPTHFYVFKTKQAIDVKTFSWQQFRQASNPKKKTTLSSSDGDAYVSLYAALGKRVPIPASGPTAGLYLKDAQEHGSVHVVVCK